MGQGRPEALAYCLAGVWGKLHTVVVAATFCVTVCACEHVRERAERKDCGGGEWLALGGGGGGFRDGESTSSWKKERLRKKGRDRDSEEEHERGKTSRGGGWEKALAGCNRLQAVPGPQLAGNVAASTQSPGLRGTHDQQHKQQTLHHCLHASHEKDIHFNTSMYS